MKNVVTKPKKYCFPYLMTRYSFYIKNKNKTQFSLAKIKRKWQISYMYIRVWITEMCNNHPQNFHLNPFWHFILDPMSAPWYARHWCSPCCSPCWVQVQLDSVRTEQRHGNGCALCFQAGLPWWEHSLPSSWAPAHTQWRPAPLPVSTPRSYTEIERKRKGWGVRGLALVIEFQAHIIQRFLIQFPKGAFIRLHSITQETIQTSGFQKSHYNICPHF